jgi:hypothetical protein
MMGAMNFRDAYEFDPETYSDEGGGLPGMLRRVMQQQRLQQQGVDFGSTPNGAPKFDHDSYGSPQGGLLGRLLALYAEQGGYEPIPGSGGPVTFALQNPRFRPLAQIPNGGPLSMASPPVPHAYASTLQMEPQYEADQAQRAREAAAARLARGARNLTRAETQRDLFNSDPVDIAKSTGIGLVNGGVNAAGLIGDALTGFGYFPNNFVANLSRRVAGLPQLPTDEPDHFKSWTSDEIRHRLENYFGEFYQPKSRAGRFAETIGEMAPMVVGGEAIGVVRGAQPAATALRELPGTLAKHAVAPGVVVQTLEEALPETRAGQTVQKAYPVLRRVLPATLAAKRYLGG